MAENSDNLDMSELELDGCGGRGWGDSSMVGGKKKEIGPSESQKRRSQSSP